MTALAFVALATGALAGILVDTGSLSATAPGGLPAGAGEPPAGAPGRPPMDRGEPAPSRQAAVLAAPAPAPRLALQSGAPPPAASRTTAQPTRAQVLIVSGLGGEPAYAEMLRDQAEVLIAALRERLGADEASVVWLAEDEATSPHAAGRATAEAVGREVLALAARAGPADPVLILLLGHGSGQGGESRFNLPGPDLTAAALSTWLAAFTTQTVAVVNAASASGGFVAALAGERRIVVTATRSPRERERTHFGGFFVDAFAGEEADTDKDERVSLLEAFQYATAEVRRRYERGGLMLTEHALLDDDGDGEGALEPSTDGPDGPVASRFFLAAAPAAALDAAAADPAVARLLEEKQRIEAAIADLRAQREELEEEEYDDRLEALLVELARINRALPRPDGTR